MLEWYRIRLTREEVESGELEILRGAFRDVYIARNAPRGMALLGTWHEPSNRYLVYCTPTAVRHVRPLLDAYSAVRDEPRHPRGLTLICGDEASLSVLLC